MVGVIEMNKSIEKVLLINIIGTLEAISNNAISISEGEKFLFSPQKTRKLINMGCDDRIVSIIEEGCELEDIESIIPHKLPENILKLKKRALDIIMKYEKIDNIDWNEIIGSI